VSQQPNGDPRHTHRVSPSEANGGVTPGPGAQQSRIQPPRVVPSLDVLQAEFEELVKSNQVKLGELAQAGTAPDPFFLIHARINHLIDSIAGFAGPNGPRWAAMTRLEFERYIAGELTQAGPAVRRMQLSEGAHYTPEMIRALARQSGTLRRAH
jgi:hypothetical protein